MGSWKVASPWDERICRSRYIQQEVDKTYFTRGARQTTSNRAHRNGRDGGKKRTPETGVLSSLGLREVDGDWRWWSGRLPRDRRTWRTSSARAAGSAGVRVWFAKTLSRRRVTIRLHMSTPNCTWRYVFVSIYSTDFFFFVFKNEWNFGNRQ